MALVSGSPKATAPKSAKVTDWVERQALEDRRPDAADANGTEEPGFKPSLAANPGYKRYDIETLLKLGYTRHLADTPLRIHPASLQGEDSFAQAMWGYCITRLLKFVLKLVFLCLKGTSSCRKPPFFVKQPGVPCPSGYLYLFLLASPFSF